MIQKQQEQGAGQETSGCRKKGQMSQMGAPVNGWQKQAQMDAAAMTPAANPFKRVSRRGFKSFFRKNTQAAPREVPKKGIRIPFRISKFKSVTSFLEWMI